MSEPRRTLSWLRSSLCADNTCVEVASGDDEEVYIRDGKMRDGVVLRFTRAEWLAFRNGVQAGDFDTV
jgi:hypothetical protein